MTDACTIATNSINSLTWRVKQQKTILEKCLFLKYSETSFYCKIAVDINVHVKKS